MLCRLEVESLRFIGLNARCGRVLHLLSHSARCFQALGWSGHLPLFGQATNAAPCSASSSKRRARAAPSRLSRAFHSKMAAPRSKVGRSSWKTERLHSLWKRLANAALLFSIFSGCRGCLARSCQTNRCASVHLSATMTSSGNDGQGLTSISIAFPAWDALRKSQNPPARPARNDSMACFSASEPHSWIGSRRKGNGTAS